MNPQAQAAAQPQQQQQRRIQHQHGRQQLADHTTAQLHSLTLRISRLEERVEHCHGDIKMDVTRQLAAINKNLGRITAQAPRQRAPGTAPTRVNNLVVELMKTPRDLFTLWGEYEHGIGGRKPAKDFTHVERGAVKQKYYRRKVLWDCIQKHVDAGWTAAAACDLVYQVYGRGLSVTRILNLMLKDRKTYVGQLHPRLRIGRVPMAPRNINNRAVV